MGQLSNLEYRQTRASLRDAFSLLLDHLDACQAHLAHAEVATAREYARKLALTADDITALCERLVRMVSYDPQS